MNQKIIKHCGYCKHCILLLSDTCEKKCENDECCEHCKLCEHHNHVILCKKYDVVEIDIKHNANDNKYAEFERRVSQVQYNEEFENMVNKAKNENLFKNNDEKKVMKRIFEIINESKDCAIIKLTKHKTSKKQQLTPNAESSPIAEQVDKPDTPPRIRLYSDTSNF